MFRYLQQRLAHRVLECFRRSHPDAVLPSVVIEQPPKIELGDFAIPIFPFAKPLRSAPLKIAEEIRAGIGLVDGISEFIVTPPGYLNARIDRGIMAAALVRDEKPCREVPPGKVLVEHSSINPNKAAHIGHLRNAILGDTFVRLLRYAGRRVDVQNYIDNTGVQVADVVVGLVYIKKCRTLTQVKKLLQRECAVAKKYPATTTGPLIDEWLDSDLSDLEPKTRDLPPDPIPVDYYFWNLYAGVSSWYQFPGLGEERKRLRLRTLHAIERGGNELSRIADYVSVRVLERHLETMERLDIKYDFLPREGEILHLHFWKAAFSSLKKMRVLTHEVWGKNKGCWVMPRPGQSKGDVKDHGRVDSDEDKKIEIDPRDLRTELCDSPDGFKVRLTHIPTGIVSSSESEKTESASQESAMKSLRSQLRDRQNWKVIVRSNGTVGYTGKDIAYHMWKFGLLGSDFGYRRFYVYGRDSEGRFQKGVQWCWISAAQGQPRHPHFGDVAENYNVIDVRQSEAQNTVKEALRDLGHGEAADHFTHFSYGMVVLTPRCAAELGYNLSEEEKSRSFIGVSGRKGFGVKADDLLDQLIASAKREVDSRHPQLSDAERQGIATQIAIGALRYFMMKFTKESVIAFDFEDALSFEGETGPYAQYAVVRATSIFRKAGLDADTFGKEAADRLSAADLANYLAGDAANEIWELWLVASKTSYVVEHCVATTEPAYLAKHVFQLAQLFNTFYHRHPILNEADEKRKQFLLATVAVVRRELIRALAVMGITVPPVM